MLPGNAESLAKSLSTGVIVAIVIGSIISLAICIGLFVILICIIKRCTESNHRRTQGMVLQPAQPYPHSWTNEYPPSTTSVPNYPPSYHSAPPPYTISPSAPAKPSYS